MPAAVTLTCMLSVVVCLCIETRETHESLVKWMDLSTITLTPEKSSRQAESDHSYSSRKTAYCFDSALEDTSKSTIASTTTSSSRPHDCRGTKSKEEQLVLVQASVNTSTDTTTTSTDVQHSIYPSALLPAIHTWPSSSILYKEAFNTSYVPQASTAFVQVAVARDSHGKRQEEQEKHSTTLVTSQSQGRGKSPIISSLASVLAISYWQNQRKKCCLTRLCPCRGQYLPPPGAMGPPFMPVGGGEINPPFMPGYSPFYPGAGGMYPGVGGYRPGQPGQSGDSDSGGGGGGEEELMDGFQSSYHVVSRPTKRRRPAVTVSSPHLHHHSYNYARPGYLHLHPISMASFTSSASGHKFHPINGGLVKWSPEQAAAVAAVAAGAASLQPPSSQVVSLSPASSSSSSLASLSSQLTSRTSSNVHSLQRFTSLPAPATRPLYSRTPVSNASTQEVDSRARRKHFINDTLIRDKRSHKQQETSALTATTTTATTTSTQSASVAASAGQSGVHFQHTGSRGEEGGGGRKRRRASLISTKDSEPVILFHKTDRNTHTMYTSERSSDKGSEQSAVTSDALVTATTATTTATTSATTTAAARMQGDSPPINTRINDTRTVLKHSLQAHSSPVQVSDSPERVARQSMQVNGQSARKSNDKSVQRCFNNDAQSLSVEFKSQLKHHRDDSTDGSTVSSESSNSFDHISASLLTPAVRGKKKNKVPRTPRGESRKNRRNNRNREAKRTVKKD